MVQVQIIIIFSVKSIRAKVLQILENDEYRVQYVDYGNSEIISGSRIRRLATELKELPHQATEAVLAFLKTPPLEDEYGREAVEFLRDLVWGKTMMANVEKKEKLASGSLRLHLSLGDRESQVLVNAALLRAGLARVASGVIPYGMWGHFENFRYEYNLTLARQLLAEAGYPAGINKTLVLVYTAGDIYEQRTSELIHSSLAQLGITVEIRPLSWEEQWALAQKGWEDPNAAQDLFIFYWWPDVLSPITYIYNMFHSESKSFNLCYYENKEFDNLIMEAYSLEGVNPDKALELYRRAQEILYRDVPGVGLWDMVDFRVARSKIGNLDKAINPAIPTAILAQVLDVRG